MYMFHSIINNWTKTSLKLIIMSQNFIIRRRGIFAGFKPRKEILRDVIGGNDGKGSGLILLRDVLDWVSAPSGLPLVRHHYQIYLFSI